MHTLTLPSSSDSSSSSAGAVSCSASFVAAADASGALNFSAAYTHTPDNYKQIHAYKQTHTAMDLIFYIHTNTRCMHTLKKACIIHQWDIFLPTDEKTTNKINAYLNLCLRA